VKPRPKRELVRLLIRNGVSKIREDGDHEVWRVGTCQTYVPKHRVISAGVCRSIRDALAPCLGKDWME